MKRATIITVLCAILISSLSIDGANRKRNVSRYRNNVKTTKVKANKNNVDADAKQTTPKLTKAENKKNTPKLGIDLTSEEEVAIKKYLSKGYIENGCLFISTVDSYNLLNNSEKADFLRLISKAAKCENIVVHTSNGKSEQWSKQGNQLSLFETWATTDLGLSDYSALELDKQGNRKVFYSIGASGNYSDGNYMASANFQVGTYLYKDVIDASVSLNIGYSGSKENSDFSGDIGLSSRYYLPFRAKKLNMTPYLGMGIGWTFSSSSMFDIRALAGVSCFVGRGKSIDIGIQYGKSSHFLTTIGFTFRPKIK